jgi:hypothetical protein
LLLGSWHHGFMPPEVAKPKVTPAQLVDGMSHLTARQLEMVIERATLLRLQKAKRVLSARESDLLRAINRGLSAERSQRLDHLQRKLRQETITDRERDQLLRLTEELEKLAAQRLEALIELADLRKTTVARLIREMGLNHVAHG